MTNIQTTIQPQKSVEIVPSVNSVPYQIDITSILLQQPNSPFAYAVSLSIVIAAITGLVKILVPVLLKRLSNQNR